MSDTINRRDAINALDCDITITGKENADVVVKTIQMFVDRIKALPPAQTIIHCKDCVHQEKWHSAGGYTFYRCKLSEEDYGFIGRNEDFCSRAEERSMDDSRRSIPEESQQTYE